MKGKIVAGLIVLCVFVASFMSLWHEQGLRFAYLALIGQLVTCVILYVVLALVSAEDRGKSGWGIFKIW